MNRDLTSQRVHQLREEIDELRFMNEIYKYKKGPVADTERVRRQGRLLEIQDELTAITEQPAREAVTVTTEPERLSHRRITAR